MILFRDLRNQSEICTVSKSQCVNGNVVVVGPSDISFNLAIVGFPSGGLTISQENDHLLSS